MSALLWGSLLLLVTILVAHTVSSPNHEGFLDGTHFLKAPVGVMIINLARRKDRLASFVASFRASDATHLPLLRLEAVDGGSLDLAAPGLLCPAVHGELEDFQKRGNVRQHHYQLTRGSIGCALSHRGAWEHVAMSGMPWIVCEDDAVLPPTFLADVQRARELVMSLPESKEANAPPAIILFQVLCNKDYWKELHCEAITGVPSLLRVRQFWSLAAVYLTPEACRAMLPRVLPMRKQLDHAMSQWVQEGLIRIYAYPVVNIMDNNGSDIWSSMTS